MEKEPLSQFIQRAYDAGHHWLAEASEHWRTHANRRTIIVLILGGALAGYLYVYVIQPPDNFPVATLVEVPAGAPLKAVSATLEEKSVVRSALALRILITLMGDERTIRAGDYVFKEPRDVFAVARALSIGAFGLEPVRIRVHEGATTKEMAVIFSRRLERFEPENFLAQARPQEGYLFPDTYFFLPNVTEDSVLQTLRQNFDQQVSVIQPQIASSTHSLDEIVKMASIVEREARISADRRMIAGVLWNRLARGMALQVDVTFLYTIGKGTFQLTTKDLLSDSPYNTYRYKGLPPTPIGSPSLDSLRAAVMPTKNDYLYYLADNTGVTHFSKTYAEHLRKKRLYLGT